MAKKENMFTKRTKQIDKAVEDATVSTPTHGNKSELSNMPNKHPAPEAMSIDDLLKPVKRAEDR